MDKWTHPSLGTFEFDGEAWAANVNIPALKGFSYDTGYSNAPRSTGKHEMKFDAQDEDDVPSGDALELALRLVDGQTQFVTTLAEALWRDFNGEGPEVGMWWHGNLEQIAESPDRPLRSAKDILPLLQVCEIRIRKGIRGHRKAVIDMSFHAAFEEEHGVSVLTDVNSVLGVGYMGEADLW
jgi:hypothetical protein